MGDKTSQKHCIAFENGFLVVTCGHKCTEQYNTLDFVNRIENSINDKREHSK